MSLHHPTNEKDRLRVAISAFAENFAEKMPDDGKNQVFSPLGAWMLLAFLAGANPSGYSDGERAQLEEALGMEIEEAAKYAQTLIENPAEAVASAAKAWGRSDNLKQEWLQGLETLNVAFSDGVPAQEEVDSWVEENTFGIIKELPANIDPSLILLLVSTLATKVKWAEPFKEVENDSGAWGDRECLLLSRPSNNHKAFWYDEKGNLFFVLTAFADGLEVVTVVPDGLGVSRETTLDFATRFVSGLIPNAYHAPLESLIDSASGLYTVTHREGSSDYVTAILPAWEAEQTIDLLKMGLPYAVAGGGATSEDHTLEAVQVAKASYTQEGFEAAAVSYALMRATSAPPMRKAVVTQVKVLVERPHAVVATATGNTAWSSLPVFQAWVRN